MIEGITNAEGRIGVLAIDHRDSLRAVIDPENPSRVRRDEIIDLKRVIIEGLADLATGVMLEPEYSIPELVPLLPVGCGFSAALESQGYSDDPSTVPTEWLAGWGPAAAKVAGASIAKLLAYYSPDARDHAAAQRRVIEATVSACRAVDIPLVLEPLPFPKSDTGPASIAAVRETRDLGADLLKVAWPGDGHIDALVEVLGDRPWVLLSGGGEFETYRDQVRRAVNAGCRGFMAGRAVWREVTSVAPDERAATVRNVARPRFEQLLETLNP